MLSALLHPSEALAMVRFKLSIPNTYEITKDLPANLRWCYEKLTQTSRSFSIVIQELGPELRDVVMQHTPFFALCFNPHSGPKHHEIQL